MTDSTEKHDAIDFFNAEQVTRNAALISAKEILTTERRSGAFSGVSHITENAYLFDVAEYILTGEIYEDAQKTKKRLRKAEGESPIFDQVEEEFSKDRTSPLTDTDGHTHDEAMAVTDAGAAEHVDVAEQTVRVAGTIEAPYTSDDVVQRTAREAIVGLLGQHGVEFQSVDVGVSGKSIVIDARFTESEFDHLTHLVGGESYLSPVVLEQVTDLATKAGASFVGSVAVL